MKDRLPILRGFLVVVKASSKTLQGCMSLGFRVLGSIRVLGLGVRVL